MVEHGGGRSIAVEISFSEETWEALTADYRAQHLDMFGENMALEDAIDLFLEVQISSWRVPSERSPWAGDLDDGVPF